MSSADTATAGAYVAAPEDPIGGPLDALEVNPPIATKNGRRIPVSAVIAAAVLVIFVVMAFAASLIAPHGYGSIVSAYSLQSPSLQFPFGTDWIGRDVLSRVIYGSQISLGIAVTSVMASLVLGTALGLAAAWHGGWLDLTIMRLVDIVFAFPAILLAIALMAVLGPSLSNLVIVIVVLFIPRFAVTVRAVARSVRSQEYIEAAALMGSRALRINIRHVLPNIAPVIIVEAALSMSAAILTEAALSFLGLGAQPPRPSWGSMLREAQSTMTIAPWTVIFPGAAIVAVVLALNVLADGLRTRLGIRE